MHPRIVFLRNHCNIDEIMKEIEALDHFTSNSIRKMSIELSLQIDLASNWNPMFGNADDRKCILNFWLFRKVLDAAYEQAY